MTTLDNKLLRYEAQTSMAVEACRQAQDILRNAMLGMEGGDIEKYPYSYMGVEMQGERENEGV